MFNHIMQYAVHVKNIDYSKKVTFDELSDEAKVIARNGLLEYTNTSHLNDLNKAKEIIKSNIHKAINDKYFIYRIFNNVKYRHKIDNPEFLDKHIIANFSEFTPKGLYIYLIEPL